MVMVCEPFRPFWAPNRVTLAAIHVLFWMKIMDASSSPEPKVVPWRLNVIAAVVLPESVVVAIAMSFSLDPLLPESVHVLVSNCCPLAGVGVGVA